MTNVSCPVTNVSGPVTNVVNNVSVKIAPWGSPLQLTDADVEAALATVPGIAGTVALPEVVAALMELVKRAASVQMGLRPMGAHLLNVAPGGPGPLLLTGPAEPAGAQQSAETARDSFDAIRACELLKSHPAVAGVTAEWLTRVTAAAGVSAMELARALRQASAAGLCNTTEWQRILQLQRDSQMLTDRDPYAIVHNISKTSHCHQKSATATF